MAPDTSFDRLHFSVQQVFAEIRIVWQLVDIWLPAPLDFGQFQDMFTTVFIGNTATRQLGGKMVTPRGYRA